MKPVARGLLFFGAYLALLLAWALLAGCSTTEPCGLDSEAVVLEADAPDKWYVEVTRPSGNKCLFDINAADPPQDLRPYQCQCERQVS